MGLLGVWLERQAIKAAPDQPKPDAAIARDIVRFNKLATAIAERSPKAQKNTTRRPVAAATSRSMPPGCRFSPIEA